MEVIWASAATGAVNDLEIVAYSIEEHLEANPRNPVFIYSNHSEEG